MVTIGPKFVCGLAWGASGKITTAQPANVIQIIGTSKLTT